MRGARNAFCGCHSRACLAREESRNSEAELRWWIVSVGEGLAWRDKAKTRDSSHAAATRAE